MDVARKKRVKRDWPAVFADFDRSGMTIKEFCREQEMCNPFSIVGVRIMLTA